MFFYYILFILFIHSFKYKTFKKIFYFIKKNWNFFFLFYFFQTELYFVFRQMTVRFIKTWMTGGKESLTITLCRKQMTSSIVSLNLQLGIPDIQTIALMTLINIIFVSMLSPYILQKLLLTQNRYLLTAEFILIRTTWNEASQLNFRQPSWILNKESWFVVCTYLNSSRMLEEATKFSLCKYLTNFLIHLWD